jgi:hypothetical protein
MKTWADAVVDIATNTFFYLRYLAYRRRVLIYGLSKK